MVKQDNIQYIVDSKGRKKSVVLSYRAYLRLLEDIDDLRVVVERSREPTIPFEDVLAELKRDGRIGK